MRRTITAALAMTVFLPDVALAAEMRMVPVSSEEARHWIRYTVPLPRQIDLSSKVALPAGRIAFRSVGDEGAPLVQQAINELHEATGGADQSATGGEGLLTITLQLGGDEAGSLRQHRYADQAYLIRPEGAGEGLRCIALGPRGLYYASKTLQQLIRARARDGRIEVPILRVTDWPDMEDRGLWGGDSSQHIRWLSDRKMNYLEHISHTTVDKDGRCHVSYPPFKQQMIDEGPTHGMNPVPVVLHLEQLARMGLFDAYPELQGKDATPGVICYSNPLLSDILARWLVLWGKTPGVSEVDVWMAENMYGKEACKCDQCRKEDRAVLETRSILKAWDIARKQLPDLGLRMLTSEASEDCNAKIIPLLPRDLKLWYYHSLFTYNTSREPMFGQFQPYLPAAIQEGRWIGVCPNLSALVGLWMPMSSPQFVHARMTEFVSRGLQGLIGYAVPEIPYCRLNTEAAAEWSWNAQGRSPREFAVSYAVRCGYADPERFADWCDALGPVSWAVYGSDFPSGEANNQPGKLADLVREGKLPALGDVLWGVYGMPFGDIRNVEQLNHDVAQAEKAVRLARELGIEEYLHESLVVQGCIEAIQALYQLGRVVKPEGVSNKASATRWFQVYLDSLGKAREHLPLWEQSLPGRERHRPLVASCVDLLTTMIDTMKETAKSFDIEVR